ncbi:MAG: ATP-binding cassette domain-containing protein, partial [Acidobacteria bacterium]|nr:ATP-binding cassette domain-containing protein [Acidobacteriota bacterium]
MEGSDIVSGSVLEARDVRLRRGPREVLCGVDLAIGRGEMVALMGLSGGGKTTFLRAVAGLEPFDAGTLTVDGVALVPGHEPPAAVLRLLRRKVGMVFQFHFL